MSRTEYVSCFSSLSEAVDFESQILSVGREFLPEVAIKVLNQENLSDSESCEYYSFLASQIEA